MPFNLRYVLFNKRSSAFHQGVSKNFIIPNLAQEIRSSPSSEVKCLYENVLESPIEAKAVKNKNNIKRFEIKIRFS